MAQLRIAISTLTIFLGILFAVGCSSNPTPKEIIQSITLSPEEQAENQPTRKLRTYVVFDNGEDLEEIKRVLRETSDILQKQLGMELEADFSSAPVKWEKRDQCALRNQLEQTTTLRGQEFDIAIGFTKRTADETFWCHLMSCWLATTDVTSGQFIIARELHPLILAHEVGHLFIFSHTHSRSGLMRASAPSLSSLTRNDYHFAQEDRKEALKNKWRKFGEKIVVAYSKNLGKGCD